MTVADLIRRLQQCEPNALVVLASDAEGNDFAPLDTANPTDGEAYSFGRFTNTQRQQMKQAGAVVLWPQ